MEATLELTRQLIELPSQTPDDAGCQRLLAARLVPLGFDVQWLYCGAVSNVIFSHGRGAPSLWFLGHTDVVPPGPAEDWSSPPFSAEVRGGHLYGRGAADMKGAVAAMATAAEAFVRDHPGHPGQLGIVLTSDEEGDAVDGTARVADMLQRAERAPQYCLVGEPSSREKLGDTVRIGRRGSVHARLQVHGVQGHSAFPEALDNPVHRLLPFLQALLAEHWDQGDGQFPPTHCQLTNVHAGTGAENVTPGHVQAWFNFRNSPASPAAAIRTRIEAMLEEHGIRNYELGWRVSGEPFRSPAGELRRAALEALRAELGIEPELNTGGGTSDGRFIAPLGSEVIELGLLNGSIHKVDENVPVTDLAALSKVYRRIMERLLGA
ncbi:MAG: succinyl-diaminopimelate desuccinylase [Lysobacterales bacterium]|jgi:succinyl-diaminopimelate desuccinylase